jgi:hypothetical protein
MSDLNYGIFMRENDVGYVLGMGWKIDLCVGIRNDVSTNERIFKIRGQRRKLNLCDRIVKFTNCEMKCRLVIFFTPIVKCDDLK